MSEAKFTKGVWFIEKDGNWNDDCWAISVKRDYDDSIHHCFAEVTYKMEYEHSNPELEANAHLIAAAPEMYEMLESASKELYQLINETNKHRMTQVCSAIETPPDLHDMETCYLIDKLLAKARGESQ